MGFQQDAGYDIACILRLAAIDVGIEGVAVTVPAWGNAWRQKHKRFRRPRAGGRKRQVNIGLWVYIRRNLAGFGLQDRGRSCHGNLLADLADFHVQIQRGHA